ncbi:uncharacterized protein B0H64DRAFT_214058 [Chaetomium fimeti]|uniref:Uncharacterized protein n=1 Tax=Chaetomium fimeti TaxID=1854472 RepID=A0AAE0HBN8_9PEZI|nr:hypothetical protein B0H64DRAFT_214058 [Chaetomium fimeti]
MADTEQRRRSQIVNVSSDGGDDGDAKFYGGVEREGQTRLVLERGLREGTKLTPRGRGLQKRIRTKWRVEPWWGGRWTIRMVGQDGLRKSEPTWYSVGGGTWVIMHKDRWQFDQCVEKQSGIPKLQQFQLSNMYPARRCDHPEKAFALSSRRTSPSVSPGALSKPMIPRCQRSLSSSVTWQASRCYSLVLLQSSDFDSLLV